MKSTNDRLDGNAAAGTLQSIFPFEMTTAISARRRPSLVAWPLMAGSVVALPGGGRGWLAVRLFAGTVFTLLVGAVRRGTRLAVAMDARGFDAVLVHWDAFPDIEPALTFHAGAGPTLRLYLRPALTLR